MLKTLPPDVNRFFNLKCGEIYCETPTDYKVNCCLCAKKLAFEEFPNHFQEEHLSQEDLSAWHTAVSVDGPHPKPFVFPLSVDESEIKSECDEEQSVMLMMDKLEDEKPIDFKELQSARRTRASKKIIVENLNVETCHSDSDQHDDQYPDEFISVEVENNDECDSDEAHIDIHAADCTENDAGNDEVDNVTKESFPCTLCKKKFLSKRAVDTHTRLKHKVENENVAKESFLCTLCPNTYLSKRALNTHMRTKHKEEYKLLRKRVKRLKCKECDEIFPSERNLAAHMFKHTGVFCDICGKTFSQLGNMRRHKIRHTGIKAHKCAECDSCFYSEKELKAHMMRHTGIFPIICEICGRRCRDHGVYTAHMRRHTGERPAKCDVCGKCFYSIYDLNVHSVTHSTLRPFKCDVCGSTFQTKKALRVHKKLHSTDRKHECKICGKKFVQSAGLYSHMRVHDPADGEHGTTITEKQETFNFDLSS